MIIEGNLLGVCVDGMSGEGRRFEVKTVVIRLNYSRFYLKIIEAFLRRSIKNK